MPFRRSGRGTGGVECKAAGRGEKKDGSSGNSLSRPFSTRSSAGALSDTRMVASEEGSKGMDKVAYVRFASVYRSFEDVDEFRQLLKDI